MVFHYSAVMLFLLFWFILNNNNNKNKVWQKNKKTKKNQKTKFVNWHLVTLTTITEWTEKSKFKLLYSLSKRQNKCALYWLRCHKCVSRREQNIMDPYLIGKIKEKTDPPNQFKWLFIICCSSTKTHICLLVTFCGFKLQVSWSVKCCLFFFLSAQENLDWAICICE